MKYWSRAKNKSYSFAFCACSLGRLWTAVNKIIFQCPTDCRIYLFVCQTLIPRAVFKTCLLIELIAFLENSLVWKHQTICFQPSSFIFRVSFSLWPRTVYTYFNILFTQLFWQLWLAVWPDKIMMEHVAWHYSCRWHLSHLCHCLLKREMCK